VFEVCWLVPAELLTAIHPQVAATLDIDADIERFGAQTLSGTGISTALPR
jgi:hypothetical protein